jgi:hypothetical protein
MKTEQEIETYLEKVSEAYDKCASARTAAIFETLEWVLGIGPEPEDFG